MCRLGLATRGNTALDTAAVQNAIDHGINYLNWCGHADGMRDCIRQLGVQRESVHVAVQLHARTSDDARRELEWFCDELNTDYLDVVTYYYVEHDSEWQQIIRAGGAAEAVEEAQAQGQIRSIGLTSHQRRLAADWAKSGRLNMLMIRYNAAHRGAEQDVFPVTSERKIPVVAFTCLRWGALLRGTSEDSRGFEPPSAVDCYRFVLCQRHVSVALMAPDGTDELRQNLALLDDWGGLGDEAYNSILAHGTRVHRHAGSFP